MGKIQKEMNNTLLSKYKNTFIISQSVRYDSNI